MADGYTEELRPRRRRGRRALITFLVVLVVVMIGLVVADRAAAAFAEREIARRIAGEVTSQGLESSPPEVTVAGVPFLTQVLAGNYDEIKILLRDVTAPVAGGGDGGTVRMPVLDIRAHDVRATMQTLRSGQGDVTARTVAGTATIDYASVTRLIGREGVRLAERDGRLAVTAPLEALGQQLTVNGTADLAVNGGAIQIRFRELTAEGAPDAPLVQSLISAYAQQISIDIDVPDLPLGLRVREVRARPEGLMIEAAGSDVPLKRP